MNARQRSSVTREAAKATMEIIGWEAADGALRALGQLDSEIAHDQAELAAAVAQLKADYDEHISGLLDARKAKMKALEAFAKAHRKEMPGKSICLTWGVLGFRAAPPSIKLLWAVERVIEALRLKKLVTCIRVIEEPNKDTLRLLDDDTLAAVGVKRTGGKDKFFAEPDLEKIVEKP